MLTALAAAVLLSAPLRAQTPPLLTVVSHRTIAPADFVPASPAAPKVAPLALVVEAGSAWDAPGVLEGMLGKASAIFAQCGVSLGAADVTVARWSPDALKLLGVVDPYKGPPESAVMSEPLLPTLRPIGLLFGKDSIPSTAKAYNKTSTAVFSAQFPAAKNMLDTFWITYDWQTRRMADEAASYSVSAHELTHILGDLKHTPAHPNLMTDAEGPGAKSGDLTPEQCDAIRHLY